MKNKLLLLAAMLLMSVASFAAGWQNPAIAKGMAPQDGTVCYLMNVEAGQYLTGAKVWYSWSTSTGLADAGQACKLVKTGDNWFITRSSDNKHTFISGEMDGKYEMHVDMGSQGHDVWEIINVKDNIYRFRIAADDATYGKEVIADWADKFIGWEGPAGSVANAVYGGLRENDGCFVDWIIISEADYKDEAFSGKLKAYQVAKKLEAAIAEAKQDCPDIDLSAQENVLANTESTAEQLQAALDSVADAVAAWKAAQLPWDQATAKDPIIVTSLITNHSFEEGNLSGWTAISDGIHGASGDCGAKENENGTYHCDNTDGAYLYNVWAYGYPITQKIMGLHEGVYRLRAMVTSSDDCTTVGITARDGLGNTVFNMVELQTNPEPDGEGKYRKQTWLTDGELLFPLVGDTTVIGAIGCAADGVSYTPEGRWWYKADNFRLEYLGNASDAWTPLMAEMTIGGDVKMQTELKNTYNAAVAKIATTGAEGYKAVAAMNEAVEANKAAYAAYQTAIDNAKVTLVDLTRSGQYYARLNRYLNTERAPGYVDPAQTEDKEYNTFKNGSAVTILQNCALSTEEMEAETEFLNKMAISSANHDLHPGQDMTYRIVNPMFSDKDGKGWTFDKINVGNPNITGGYADFPCAEAWRGGDLRFKVHQTIADMPAGLYSISCNAFVRMGGNQSAAIDDNGDAYLYMGDFENEIPTIFHEGITEEDWNAGKKDEIVCGKALSTNDQPWTLHTSLGKYFPDGMKSASQAFAMGMYKTTAYGLVEETGDVEIGFAKLVENSSNNQWVLWTNFQLIYEGDNPDATSAVIYKLMDDNSALNNKIAEKGIKMPSDWGSDETDLLAKATGDLADYEAAPGAVSDELKAALFDDVNQITKMMKEKRARVTVLEKFAEELQALDDSLGMLYEKWDMYDPDGELGIWDALDEWDDLRMAHKQKLAAGAASSHMDEFRAKNAEFQVITRTPELDEEAASDEPQDLTGYLANPTMDNADFFNWNGTAFANQLGNGVTGGEIFNAKYDAWHDLYLNPGFYQFKVYGFDRRGSWAEEDVDDEKNYAFVYVAKVVGGDTTLVAQLPMRTGYSLWSEEALADEDGCIHADAETYPNHADMWVPNNMNTAMQWHQALKDEEIDEPMSTAINFEVKAGAEDVHYILGVKKDELKGSNSWTIIEEVQLVYAADQKVDAIQDIEPVVVAPGVLVDGKYLENGKVVIIKNGVKYMLNGARK